MLKINLWTEDQLKLDLKKKLFLKHNYFLTIIFLEIILEILDFPLLAHVVFSFNWWFRSECTGT